ncbi:MAG TPA: hypothetical protein PKZ61_18435, partial [Thermoflexales bacterium]|nr:hypothetical protein [Thermoflexales bacterium]
DFSLEAIQKTFGEITLSARSAESVISPNVFWMTAKRATLPQVAETEFPRAMDAEASRRE